VAVLQFDYSRLATEEIPSVLGMQVRPTLLAANQFASRLVSRKNNCVLGMSGIFD